MTHQGVLARIPLSQIRENPVALRKVDRQKEEYLAFADSVAKQGVLNPIVVREITAPEGETLYGIIEGLHRYTASLDAGFKDIPANIVTASDAEVEELQLIGNAHRIETKPVEYSKHLQQILSRNPLMTLTQLAAKLSKSPAWITERLGLVKLSENIAALVDGGKVNLTNAYSLAKLPEDEQLAFLDRAMTMNPGEFGPTVLARKKEIDAAKRQGREARPSVFTPVPHLRKLSEIKAEHDSQTIAQKLITENGVTTPEDAFALAVAWMLHMDKSSIELARQKDEVRRKSAEEQKAKAAAERAEKRAREAAEALAKAGA